jgi:hypothetical protein
VTADQAFQTQANINSQAYDAFTNSAIQGYRSKLDALNTGGALVQQLMTKYNIDQETAQRELDRKLEEKIQTERNKIAKLSIKPSGGSGGGSGSSSGSGAPGWEIVG